jgi:succinyl-diaminopimelate desuccinylase
MVADAVALTGDLVRFDTINPPGAEAACIQQVARLLEAAGFELGTYDFAPGRPSLVARIGGRADAPPLCFTGHVDTVPLGGQPWTRDPHAAEIAGGRLYGRGSTDMKSGLAAFVTAAIELAPHLARTAGVVLVITAGEETGCDGARHLIGLPGVLGRAGAIVVAEPTGNEPLVGHKGALWLQARTSGVAAHGSMPERGVNAISKAARAVTRLEQFTFDVPPHPVLGAATLNVGTIAGGINVNSVPDAATIGIDIRTIPGQRHAAVLQRLGAHLGREVTLAPFVDIEGIWTQPDDPWVQDVFDIVTPVLGERPAGRAAPYFTDVSLLAPAYGYPPSIVLGPGELALVHQTDEYCLVERIEQAVALYVGIAQRWCHC